MSRDIFENLFVLELANNHWGKLERGLQIVSDFTKLARFNGVRACIKLQLRDVDNFIHKDFRSRTDIRYIKKTLDTQLKREEFFELVKAIKDGGCLIGATPFDEASVQFCMDLGVDIMKIASSDINDWYLIEEIGRTKKPVAFSTGGSSQKDIDDVVKFFENRHIPLAINHCVSLYPTHDSNLEMNQIDFLKERYPGHTIGFSTHEYTDWTSSIMIAYAKGARIFERHIDIDDGTQPVSSYCTQPEQCDVWFKAFKKAVEMCGGSGAQRRVIGEAETRYLDSLVRGAYAKRDLPKGHRLSDEDLYLAIPLQKGQMSCRELMRGEVLLEDVTQDAPLMVEQVDSPAVRSPAMMRFFKERGL